MQAYVFYNSQSDNREQLIRDHIAHLHISSFDCVSIEMGESSIGIAQVRAFIRSLALAPQNSEYTAGILKDAHLLTMEAQQALLKTLEEPPKHAYIFLGAEHEQQLIPTIRSRCITISRTSTKPDVNEEERSKVSSLISGLLSASSGEKIRLIQGIGKSKEDIDRWIGIALDILREEIISQKTDESAHKATLIHRLLSAKKHLANNIQPLLLVEHAILDISSNHNG